MKRAGIVQLTPPQPQEKTPILPPRKDDFLDEQTYDVLKVYEAALLKTSNNRNVLEIHLRKMKKQLEKYEDTINHMKEMEQNLQRSIADLNKDRYKK